MAMSIENRALKKAASRWAVDGLFFSIFSDGQKCS